MPGEARHWWRREPKIQVASLDQLQARIAQLERQLERRPRALHTVVGDWTPDPVLHDSQVAAHGRNLLEKLGDRLPGPIREALDRSAAARFGDLPALQASGVTWRDTLTPRRVLIADGAQVLNTTTETIMCPDFTFAADYFEVGDTFKYTLIGDLSGQAAANTVTFRLKYGGSGGTAMATSGAFAWDPTAASTTLSHMVEYWFVCRATGTAGSFFTMGRLTPADFDDASVAALVANLNMLMIPTSAPAVVGSLDTTAAKAISPTVAFSSATATVQWTNHIAILESLN